MDKIKQGLNEIFMITPTIIEDLYYKCTLVEDDANVMKEWLQEHPHPSELFTDVASSLLRNSVGNSLKITKATAAIATSNYYEAGHNIGMIANTIVMNK